MAGPDTIFAPATPPGRSAIAVLRVSGPSAAEVCRKLTRRPPPAPRMATLRTIRDPTSAGVTDRAMVLWFEGPRSATGEDVLELHLHGGPAVLRVHLEMLSALPDLRPAEPGEFSRRAVRNGRLDLLQAEAVADLIDARTGAQVGQAGRQLTGGLGDLYEAWRRTLLSGMARIEAEIDFAPEEEVPEGGLEPVREAMAELARAIEGHLADGGRGETLRDGLTIAVIGPPNVGKSTLVNRLAAREVAIVHESPGTTRDVLEVALDIGGLPVTLLDTAGLRDARDPVEAEGIRRARRRAEAADIRALVLDGSAPAPAVVEPSDLVIRNKLDLGDGQAAPDQGARRCPTVGVSCLTGHGLDELERLLGDIAADRMTVEGGVYLTRARHRSALGETAGALRRFVDGPGDLALAAEDLRVAADRMARLTGRILSEEVLDDIFSNFCIGK